VVACAQVNLRFPSAASFSFVFYMVVVDCNRPSLRMHIKETKRKARVSSTCSILEE
jgi:hypothetical protein